MARKEIKIDLLIHDLKNPLAVIQAGLSGLLSRREQYGPLTPRQERVLTRLLRNTRAAQMLTHDALELARSGEGIIVRTETPLKTMIREMLTEFFDLIDSGISEPMKSADSFADMDRIASPAGLVLAVEPSLLERSFLLDADKTRQILRNLLSNAFKYRKRQVDFAVRQDGGNLVFSVKDDGDGIPCEYHRKIFEAYFQLSAAGSDPVRGHGVGLAGALALARDLGGDLSLVSGAGCGAAFIVRLPAGCKDPA
ncbi:sensor histidine kinase [Desulfococcus sp.]|uniref:sensor histidine kinase n=1 Tax=Desulfococcus sp. TaxID=2025834 RepID=UPI003593B1E7